MPPAPNIAIELARRRRLAAIGVSTLMQGAAVAISLYGNQWYWKQAYHTSALTGEAWVMELIQGHPERIRSCLGMRVHVFMALIGELRLAGLTDSRHVTLKEKVAIFLYTSVTGLSVRHVGERFQRANETISKYFKEVLIAISSPPFYNQFVKLPHVDDPVPPEVRNNPKWYPFFEGAVGALDGTHISCSPSAEDRAAARNRKGGVSQNTLACCSFDMRFQYIASGWEGSAADATIFYQSRLTDFRVPDGKYYLADAGFGACDALLVPYRGVRYHLAEWGRASVRPANKEELYNLRHASARNVIERIFGALKKRFGILVSSPEYGMDIQARIPPALAAIHNFILHYDRTEIDEMLEAATQDPSPGNISEEHGNLTYAPPSGAEKERAREKRDQIAQDMWDSYQLILAQREEELE